jgi:4-amino-4-deoxy-L-arabinose transferase-like glycosyltransferase
MRARARLARMQTNPPPLPEASQSLAARIGWLVLILATLYVCYFSNLGAIGFVGPDEPRYAWIARDMAESGDWVTPRLYGKPWFEKPPLYYWEAALSFKLFGVGEAAARLPSALSALLATLAMAWLALRLYGEETARWLLLLLPTTAGMIGFSHAAATDMPFSAMVTIAMVAAAVLLRLDSRPDLVSPTTTQNTSAQPTVSLSTLTQSTLFTAIVFGFFLGLAVLAKGPAGLILCGGAVFFWAAITKRWRDCLRVFHPAGIAVFCLTALPWYILCARRNPDFFRIFIIEHNFKRFLTPEFQHIQPFWFYAAILLVAFLPWTAALIWTLFAGSRRLFQRRKLAASDYFLLCWSGFCVLFFTVSRSKLPGYILPAIPAIGLMLSRCAVLPGTAKRRSFAIASLGGAALFGCAFAVVYRHEESILKNLVAFAPLFVVVVLALALANFLLGAFFLFSRKTAGLFAAVLTVLLAFALLDDILQFTPVSIISARYLADQLQANRVPIGDLRVAGIRRGTLYGLNFYLRANLLEWDRDPSRETYVLATGRLPCSKIPKELDCSVRWGQTGDADNFELLHLIPNASGPRSHP